MNKSLYNIIVALLFSLCCQAQNKWEIVSKNSFDSSFTAPLMWKYKETVFLLAEPKLPNLFKLQDNLNNLRVMFIDRKTSIKPPDRRDPCKWVTSEGLWLFGGISYTNDKPMNDLWLYKTDKKEWERMDSQKSTPGGRKGAVSWVGNKKLYLFGGTACDSSGNETGLNNELWYFDIEKNEWVSEENKIKPSPRVGSAVWNLGDQKKIIYGGLGYSDHNTRLSGLSDLWEFDCSTGKWTSLDKEPPPYERFYGGLKGNPHPGYRIKPSYWNDQQGYFWLTFGQSVVTQTSVSVDTYLWRLNPKDFSWEYFSAEIESYAIDASCILSSSTGETLMFFPTLINKNLEVTDSPFVLSLKSTK